MNFTVLIHVRDHSKPIGSARHLLLEIATHINYHSGVTRLSVDRLAHRLHVGARHVRKLLAGLEASGELVIWRSAGRHANTYQIATHGCAACDARANPALRDRVDINRGLEGRVHPRNPGSQDRQPGLRGPAIKKYWKEEKQKDAELATAHDERPPIVLAPRLPPTPPMRAYPCGVRGCERLTCIHSYVCPYHGTCAECQPAAP